MPCLSLESLDLHKDEEIEKIQRQMAKLSQFIQITWRSKTFTLNGRGRTVWNFHQVSNKYWEQKLTKTFPSFNGENSMVGDEFTNGAKNCFRGEKFLFFFLFVFEKY